MRVGALRLDVARAPLAGLERLREGPGRSTSARSVAETPPTPTDACGRDFWSPLYQTGDTRFDKGRIAPPIARMAQDGDRARKSVV